MYNEGTLQDSIELAAAGYERYPHHYEINLINGYCHYLKYGKQGHQDDLDRAIEFYDRGFWACPLKISNILYPELLLLNKNFGKAVEICRVLIPTDASMMAKYKLGRIYYYMGRWEESRKIIEELKDIIGYRNNSLLYLGMIAARNQNFSRAEELASIELNLSPDLYDVDLYLSSIYFGIKNEKLGHYYLKRLFDNPTVRDVKYFFIRLVEMDSNFEGFIKSEDLKDNPMEAKQNE